MRERLTAVFVAITLLVLLGAGFVRSYAVAGEMRERESDFVASQARTIGQGIARRSDVGAEIDAGFLEQYVVPGIRIDYERPGSDDLVLTGSGFVDSTGDPAVSGSVITADGAITVTRSRSEPVPTMLGGGLTSTLGLLALLAVIAGLVGYAVARSLSEPFRQLAVAAAALGRGRLDLDLPTTSMPEARAIARALDSSAAQLRDRLEREREFGLLASHVLRTPLTSLRLNLEDLVGDPTISDAARETALSCLVAVSRIGEVAGELVEVSGRGVLVAGAAIPLRDLATQVAQRWSEELDVDGRVLSAAVEGDIELLFTPGPVEQVLDLVLDEVLARHTGDVRLVFEGQATTLTVDITCQDASLRASAAAEPLPDRTAAVLTALGGRIEVAGSDSALRVMLPRR